MSQFLGNERCCSLGLHDLHAGFSGGIRFKLGVVFGAEEMRIEKISSDKRYEDVQRFGRREVFGDVTRRVPPYEGEVRPRLQIHWPHKKILQRGIGAAMLAQRELRKRTVADGRTISVSSADWDGNHSAFPTPSSIDTASAAGNVATTA